MKIFISYGHDIYCNLAERLRNDLSSIGYQVWFDKNKLYGSVEWENAIEDNILSSEWMIILMTNHSVRRPDGVCLDEVSLARFNNKKILPIMVQMVEPPFCITRIQWLDMMGQCCDENGNINESTYAVKFNDIKNILSGIKSLGIEGETAVLINALNPIDNDVYSNKFMKDFYGRKWLLKRYEDWLTDERSKIFMILGGGGIGKTAFAASLCRRSEIIGIHFCKYNDSDRSDPKRALMSLAYQMATQLPEYSAKLLKLRDLNSLNEKSITRLFEYVFLEPLKDMTSDRTRVIIIDALDEAQIESRNDLLSLISESFINLPKWIKVVLTSRPENDIRTRLYRFNPLIIDECEENDEDVIGYIREMLKNEPNKDVLIDKIISKSHGNFLYASETVKEVRTGELNSENIDSFPDGLSGIYMMNFDRFFSKDITYYNEKVRPFLEILTASFEPFTIDEITEITVMDEYEGDELISTISSMFHSKGRYIAPMHKSVYDWLTDGSKSGRYKVSLKHGHKILASYASSFIDDKKIPNWVIKYSVKHNLRSNNYERASELLSDKRIQKNKLSLLGTDTFLYDYFRELEELHNNDSSLSYSVMSSDLFFDLFIHQGIQMMHDGMFRILSRCGFDPIARDIYRRTNDFDVKLSVARYSYNTEHTHVAQKIFLEVLNTIPKDHYREISEASDMVGLCFKKYVDIDNAVHYLKQSIKVAPNRRVGASSSLNLSKIRYHQLLWEEAIELSSDAIAELQGYIDDPEITDDERTSSIQFKSEFYRVKAEGAMWHNDIDTCDKCFIESDKIHERYDMHDQYQPRYLYTKIFIKILKGLRIDDDEFDSAYDICVGKFDKSRLLFYRGLYHFANKDIDKAKDLFVKAYDLLEVLGSELEKEEVYCALRLCGGYEERIYTNRYICDWVEYTERFYIYLQSKY